MALHESGSADLYIRIMAALLLLTGAVMLFTDLSAGLAFALIAIGAALAVVPRNGHRRGRESH